VTDGEHYPVLLISLTMAQTKPFVQVACLCDTVIVGSDQVATLVRIIDTFSVDLRNPLPDGTKAMVALTIFISVKSGDVSGKHRLGLRLRRPSKTPQETNWLDVELNGGVHGANINLAVNLVDPTEGLYWFDVFWNGEAEQDLLTAIPFFIRPESQQAAAASATTRP
jgi:hypothetical protein